MGQRIKAVARLRSYDTSTADGRSKERYRRAFLTIIASGGARVVASLASLVSVPLTFSYLGAERYGMWMVLVSIISTMTFADLGMGNGLVNCLSEAYGQDDHERARQYVSSAFIMMTMIALFFAILGGIAYPFLPWARIFNSTSTSAAREGGWAFLVLYASFVMNLPLSVVMRAQSGIQKGYLSQSIAALGNVLTLAAILIVIKLHGSLVWLVSASVGGQIASTIVNGCLLFKMHPWLLPARSAYRAAAASKIVRLGLMFFALQCAIAIGYTSDNIVVAQIMGAAAVAIYAVPQKMFNFVATVTNMAMNPLWPAYGEAIARGDVRWVRRTFWNTLRLLVGMTAAINIILVMFGPWVLNTLFGKKLSVPLPVLIVLATWGIVSCVSTTCSVLLNGASILRAQSVLGVISSLLNLLMSIVLTKRYGVIGVCLGSTISQVLIAYPYYIIAIPKFFRGLEANKPQLAVS